MQNDEERLLKRILSRDRRALRQFYITYSTLLINFIRQRVSQEEDMEEIAQDTLFAFLDGIRDFTHKCTISTYLCSIANNKIVDFYRKKKIKRIVFSRLPESFEPLISEILDPQKIYDRSTISQRITLVFSVLNPQYARIITLKYVEDKSIADIARMLDCSYKAAESLLFRARKAFTKTYRRENL